MNGGPFSRRSIDYLRSRKPSQLLLWTQQERRIIRQLAAYYWASSPAKRKIKLRVGTHGEDHRHEV